MDKVALLPADDRAALFGETGAGRGVTNTIIEKDFWVCWTLKRLFGLQQKDTATLVFKGGTSLSKAFGGISKKKAEKLIEALVSAANWPDFAPPLT
ncbi:MULTISPECIES: hypothetical protein [unclassified Rhizobium]|uniref:hypothetical protein n=1 Tax=unclassified Rhizobium TaxID=2613769 RepID=UPI003864005D